MRGLTIIVATTEPVRLHAALSVAAANAATGAKTRMFFQGEAVAMLRAPIGAPNDEIYSAHGLPTLAELFSESLALGVTAIACQSGLALAGMTADELPPGVEAGGLVALLSECGEDRLLFT